MEQEKQQEKNIRIAIVSDTHDHWPVVLDSIRQCIHDEGKIDYLMFLGDYAADGRQLEQALKIPAYVVRGNCDGFSGEQEEQLIELGGWSFFICHGHRYDVKRNLQNIYYRGMELGVDFVLYGHTHQAEYQEEDAEKGQITLINPGAVDNLHLRFDAASWGLLTLSEKKSENFFKKYEKRACQTL